MILCVRYKLSLFSKSALEEVLMEFDKNSNILTLETGSELEAAMAALATFRRSRLHFSEPDRRIAFDLEDRLEAAESSGAFASGAEQLVFDAHETSILVQGALRAQKDRRLVQARALMPELIASALDEISKLTTTD